MTRIIKSRDMNDQSNPISDVTSCAESAIYILQIFANNFATKRDIRDLKIDAASPTMQ